MALLTPEQKIVEILEKFGKDSYEEQWVDKQKILQSEAKQQLLLLLEETCEYVIGKDDRDYSHDNADEESLKILIAASTTCNDLRKEQRNRLQALKQPTNGDKQ